MLMGSCHLREAVGVVALIEGLVGTLNSRNHQIGVSTGSQPPIKMKMGKGKTLCP